MSEAVRFSYSAEVRGKQVPMDCFVADFNGSTVLFRSSRCSGKTAGSNKKKKWLHMQVFQPKVAARTHMLMLKQSFAMFQRKFRFLLMTGV